MYFSSDCDFLRSRFFTHPPSLINFGRFLFYSLALSNLYLPGNICSRSTFDELLNEGTRLFAARQFSDALALYIQAVDLHPKSYLLYYKRGTTYVALGRPRLALADFDESLKLNPSFSPAIEQRGNLYLKTGDLSAAKADFTSLHAALSNPESSEKLKQISALERQVSEARRLYEAGQYSDTVPLLDALLEVMRLNAELLEMRGNSLLELGHIQQGFDDLRRGVHLVNDNRAGLLRLSQLLHRFGFAVESRKEVHECLKLDQDDRDCLKHYKIVNKLSKAITKAQETFQSDDFDNCITNAKEILRLEPSNPEYQTQAKVFLCSCLSRSHGEGGVSYCEEVAQRFPHNVELQCDLAESYIDAEKYDDAIRVCQKIMDADRRNQRANELHQKAQKLKQQSSRVDYYKLLGVSRKATKDEIRRAFRKLSRTHHPDKHHGEAKVEAEKMFTLMTTAKDVLLDDKMREMYDNGGDPMNPQQQQPFAHPFSQFGGFSFGNMNPFGNAHFEFHFE